MRKPETIIDDFVREKTSQHRNPVRKGIKRGERIGFPLAKEKAVLLSMRGVKQKGISKKLKISFSLVRKWATEPGFRDKVERYSKEVIHRVISEIDAIDKSFKTPAGPPAIGQAKTRIGRTRDYGPLLTTKLVQSILDRATQRKDFLFLNTAYRMIEGNLIEPNSILNEKINLHFISAAYHWADTVRKNLLESTPAEREFFVFLLDKVLDIWRGYIEKLGKRINSKALAQELLSDGKWIENESPLFKETFEIVNPSRGTGQDSETKRSY